MDAVRWALELGYRHIDTALAYGNEESVGQGLRESGVPREDVFITTKFFPRRRDPVSEIERSLQRLGVDHVDLYIIHWPERARRARPHERHRSRARTQMVAKLTARSSLAAAIDELASRDLVLADLVARGGLIRHRPQLAP